MCNQCAPMHIGFEGTLSMKNLEKKGRVDHDPLSGVMGVMANLVQSNSGCWRWLLTRDSRGNTARMVGGKVRLLPDRMPIRQIEFQEACHDHRDVCIGHFCPFDTNIPPFRSGAPLPMVSRITMSINTNGSFQMHIVVDSCYNASGLECSHLHMQRTQLLKRMSVIPWGRQQSEEKIKCKVTLQWHQRNKYFFSSLWANSQINEGETLIQNTYLNGTRFGAQLSTKLKNNSIADVSLEFVKTKIFAKKSISEGFAQY